MESINLIGVINEIDTDPRLVFALVVIVSFLKRMIPSVKDRFAEITSFGIAQILAWGYWLSDIYPFVAIVGLNFLSGVGIWIAGKAGYKAFKTAINRNWSNPLKTENKERVVSDTNRSE